MTKENTANLMGKCLNGKMSIREHFNVVFNIVKSNIKDMAIIGVLFSLPIAIMFTMGAWWHYCKFCSYILCFNFYGFNNSFD